MTQMIFALDIRNKPKMLIATVQQHSIADTCKRISQSYDDLKKEEIKTSNIFRL